MTTMARRKLPADDEKRRAVLKAADALVSALVAESAARDKARFAERELDRAFLRRLDARSEFERVCSHSGVEPFDVTENTP